MAGVFISYRRDDAQGWAGRLAEDLQRSLPGVRVFRDIEAIPAGTQYAEYTVEAVGSCDVLIALIGPRWTTATDERGNRRLDDPRDLTRLEIAAALRRNVRVIPTLVAGASMPRRESLPDDLQPLLERQSYLLDDRAWKDDVKRLVAVLAPLVSTRRRLRAGPVAAATVLALLLLALAAYASLGWFDRGRSQGAALQSVPSAPQPTPIEPLAKSPQLSKDVDPPERPAPTSQPADTARPPDTTTNKARSPDTTTRSGNAPVEKPSMPPPPERLNAERVLLDAQVKARSAYTSAVSWLDRAEKAAKSARAFANEAVRASGDAKSAFPTRASYEATQAVMGPLRKHAAAASQAAGRAEEGARKVREAVAAAEANAQATAKATEPDAAGRTASAAGAAEDAARIVTADVEKEAEAAAQFARAAASAFDQVMAQAPSVAINKASCVSQGQARYRVELIGEAKGPPTSSLSIHVSGTTAYSFEVNLICTAWRPGRRGDGAEDRYTCVNGDIGTPFTRWTAEVFFFPQAGDIPPNQAAAQVNDGERAYQKHVVVPLNCQ